MIIYEKVWNEEVKNYMALTEDLISLFEINKQRNERDNRLDDEAIWRFINAVGSDSAFINTM